LDIDLQEIFRVLNEIMPYLAKQKMREDFERNRIQMQVQKEMEIMGKRAGYEEEKQARTSENQIKLELVKTGKIGVKDLDRPLDELLYRLGQAGVTAPAIPTISPEILEQRRRPFIETMVDQAGALERGKYLPAEKMGVATQLLGSKRAMELLEEIEKTRAGRKERGLREREVIVKEEELGLKKKGEKLPKELEKKLENKIKELRKYEEKRSKLRGSPETAETGEEIKYVNSVIEETKQEINELRGKIGRKTDEEYRALAADLNRRRLASKPEDLDTNRELRQSLIAQGYNIARLKKFFK